MTASVDIVLPVLNEAEAIPWVLGRMPTGYRALVVDNGSTDGSSDIARRLGAVVVDAPERGFGAACYAGLTAATADVVAFMDCDGSLDPADLPGVVEPVASGSTDLMLAARDPERGAWPIHARIGNRVVAARVRRITGYDLRDLGPMRAARRDGLVALGIRDRGSGWPLEMVLRAHEQRWDVRETSVRYRRRSGRSKVTGTVRGTIAATRAMSGLLAEAQRSNA